jgi:hypothetical protein
MDIAFNNLGVAVFFAVVIFLRMQLGWKLALASAFAAGVAFALFAIEFSWHGQGGRWGIAWPLEAGAFMTFFAVIALGGEMLFSAISSMLRR